MLDLKRDEASLGPRVALMGIAASAVLAALNITVGLATHSTSVWATGIEFAGDVLASSVVFLGLVAASKPADDDHPYGHGRAETLAAFVVGLVLSAGGLGICWNSLQELGAAHPPPAPLAFVVLVVAIAVRIGMSSLKFRVGRRQRSAALLADAWNDAVDILAATVALGAVTLARYDAGRFAAADHYGGFAVGLVVVATGGRVLRDAALELMDTMPDGAMMTSLRATVGDVPGVMGVDKAYARKTGLRYHVDLHVEVDPTLSVAAAHAIAGHVRRRVRDALPWVADVLVHVEPSSATAGDPGPR